MVSTNPDYELVTHYLHEWVATVINQAGSYGITSTNLVTWAVTRYQFETSMNSQDPIFVWLNGHGNTDRLAGQDSEIILDLNNAGILSGRICYAFSCLTATSLGSAAVSQGCTSYIGYEDEFVFLYDVNSPDPLSDTYAKWFMDAGSKVGLSLLQGKSTGKAYLDSQDLMNSAISYWSRSSDPTASHMLACLYQDKSFQRVLGSTTITITGEEGPPVVIPTIQSGSLFLFLMALGTGIYMLAQRKR
jgi:hypothetical protein